MAAEIQLGWNNNKLQAGAAGAAAIVNKASAQMRGALANIGQGLGVGAGFAIFDTLKNTVTGSISALAEATVSLDSMRLGMTVLEGSTEAANARLQEMRDLAKLPGLGFEQAVEGDIRLRSAGISASISKRAIEEMGNALAAVGKGKGDMDGVILALSQIASKGKVSAEEINQIAERVPQIRAILKTTFGTADTEAIQKMEIPVERFISMVVEGFEKTVPRAMVGLRGGWDNLTDAMTSAAAGFGESIGKSLIGPMDDATSSFEESTDKIKAAGELTADVMVGVGATVGLVASGIKYAADVYGNYSAWMLGVSDEVKAFNEASAKAADVVKSQAKEVAALKKEYDECEAVAQRVADEVADDTRAREKNADAISKQSDELQKLQDSLEAAREKTSMQDSSAKVQQRQQISKLDTIDSGIEAAAAFGDKEAVLRLEIERESVLQSIGQLERQIKAETQSMVDDEESLAKAAAARAESNRKGLDVLLKELDIIEATANGHDKKASRLQRELDIQEKALQIVERTGIAYAEAGAIATRMVDAQAKADNRDKDGNGGRSKIKGYSQEQGDAGDARKRAETRVNDAREKAMNAVDRTMGMKGFSESRLTPRGGEIGAKTPATDAPKASGDSELAAMFKAYSDKTVEIFEKALA